MRGTGEPDKVHDSFSVRIVSGVPGIQYAGVMRAA